MAQQRARATKDPDKPIIHATAAKLQPAATPEPFVYVTKTSRRVVFPDPFDMEWEQAEQFLDDLARMGNSKSALQAWLSEDSFEALQEEHLTLREGLTLVSMVQQHYQEFLGTLGEDQTSKR